MDKATLRPCPFCGGEPRIAIGMHHFHDAMVVCDVCGTESGLFNDAGENLPKLMEQQNSTAARLQWNTRPIEDKLQRDNEALLEALRIACADAWPDNPHWPDMYLKRARSNISVAAIKQAEEGKG